MMSLLYNVHVYGPSIISTLFRVLSFVFLRVVPLRVLPKTLVALYVLYLSTWVHAALFRQHLETWEDKYLKPKNPDALEASTSRATTLRVLLLTLPEKSVRTRLIHLAINTLLLLASLDFVLHPYFDPVPDATFTRVGAVSPDSAKIVVRYPEMLPNVTQHDIRVIWREAKGNVNASSTKGWKRGPVLILKESEDWVGTVKLTGLWPSTAYEYKLTHLNKTHLPYPAFPISFRTFPDPRLEGTHFRFIASSCLLPNYPYLPLQSRTIKGFDLLAKSLWPRRIPGLSANETTTAQANTPSPASFLLFLGDFIYADIPTYIGDELSAYRRLYRRNYASESFRKVYERLPIFHAYDDHEFTDNFVGLGNDTTSTFVNGSSAYNSYVGEANYDSPHRGESYYDFRYGDVAFFVLDTRRHRTKPTEEASTNPTMLGDRQLAVLHHWLHKANTTATFKFIVSSVPFTSLWSMPDSSDSWSGYPAERDALLAVMHTIPNLIIVSGDRHEAAIVEYTAPTPDGRIVLEVSTSPLSQMASPFRGLALRRESQEKVIRLRKKVIEELDPAADHVVTVEEIVPREKLLKSFGSGNYKWSSFEVDTRDRENPVVKLELWVGGKMRYSLEILGKPVKISYTMALGALLPDGVREVWDKLGIKPSRWF